MDPRISDLPEILRLPVADIDGDASPAPMRFFSYKDPEQNTQMKKVRAQPWIAKEVPVRGFIFDVETGLIREGQQVPEEAAA